MCVSDYTIYILLVERLISCIRKSKPNVKTSISQEFSLLNIFGWETVFFVFLVRYSQPTYY